MTSFNDQEMDDMHYIYDFADGNALEARTLYEERF